MKKIFLATIVSLIFLAPVKATHFMGGEVTWECIKSGPTQGMYIFRLKLYRDCNGTTIIGAQTITVYNHPSVFSITVNLIPCSTRVIPLRHYFYVLAKIPKSKKFPDKLYLTNIKKYSKKLYNLSLLLIHSAY